MGDSMSELMAIYSVEIVPRLLVLKIVKSEQTQGLFYNALLECIQNMSRRKCFRKRLISGDNKKSLK